MENKTSIKIKVFVILLLMLILFIPKSSFAAGTNLEDLNNNNVENLGYDVYNTLCLAAGSYGSNGNRQT